MRDEIADIIESVYGNNDSHLVVPAILALFQKLVESKREYWKGITAANRVLDDLLSEMK